MSERDQEINRQRAAIGDQKSRLRMELSNVWARVKWVHIDSLGREMQRPTKKQQDEIDRLAREIEKCETAQNALMSAR